MNNKKVALFVFIALIAVVAVGAGALYSLGRHIQANLLDEGLSRGASVASSLVAETDFEKCGKFNDINPSMSFCWLTRIMRDRNIFTGDANGNFRPDNQITRAEFAKILIVTLYGNSITLDDPNRLNGSTLGFNDLSGTNWAYPYIKIAKEKGLIGGYPDGTFRMTNNVTRAEFAKMLYSQLPDLQAKIDEAMARMYSANTNPENLGIAGQWYTDYMVLLYYSNSMGTFLSDCGGKLCPEKNITRLEIAAAIQRLTNLSSYMMTIGFGKDDITGDVNEENCQKIRRLTDMTQTLKTYGITTSVMGECAKKYPSVWMQNNTPPPQPIPNTSNITDELNPENCLKITRLANMTATLQSLGFATKLMTSCANAYPDIWGKCTTMMNWKTLYGTSGLSTKMTANNPPFTHEDSSQCRDKYGSSWFNTTSI